MVPKVRGEIKLKTYRAILDLEEFTSTGLCARAGLEREQVYPILSELQKSGVLEAETVKRERSDAGGRPAHRPPKVYRLTADLKRREELWNVVRPWMIEAGKRIDEYRSSDVFDRASEHMIRIETELAALDPDKKPPAKAMAVLDELDAGLERVREHLEVAALQANLVEGKPPESTLGRSVLGLAARLKLATGRIDDLQSKLRAKVEARRRPAAENEADINQWRTRLVAAYSPRRAIERWYSTLKRASRSDPWIVESLDQYKPSAKTPRGQDEPPGVIIIDGIPGRDPVSNALFDACRKHSFTSVYVNLADLAPTRRQRMLEAVGELLVQPAAAKMTVIVTIDSTRNRATDVWERVFELGGREQAREASLLSVRMLTQELTGQAKTNPDPRQVANLLHRLVQLAPENDFDVPLPAMTSLVAGALASSRSERSDRTRSLLWTLPTHAIVVDVGKKSAVAKRVVACKGRYVADAGQSSLDTVLERAVLGPMGATSSDDEGTEFAR